MLAERQRVLHSVWDTEHLWEPVYKEWILKPSTDAALLSAVDYQNKVISDLTFGMSSGKCGGDLSRVQLLMRRPVYDLLWQRLTNTCISLRPTLLHLSLRMPLERNTVKTPLLWSWKYM